MKDENYEYDPNDPNAPLPDLFITTAELNHGIFSKHQLKEIKKAAESNLGPGYLTEEWRKRMVDMCSKLNPRALRQIADFRIRYASDIAKAELTRRRTNG